MERSVPWWTLACATLLAGACGDDATTSPRDAGASTDAATTSDAGSREDAGPVPFDAGPLPEGCEAPGDGLQDVTTSDAAPYLVSHPVTPTADVATVVFLPGGSGTRDIAEIVWRSWLDGPRAADFRVAVPYATDGDLSDEQARIVDIARELIACHGGDPARVHLGGTSIGGLTAYDLMLEQPDEFATLLGAPGMFTTGGFVTWAEALEGKAVFNGVGENDTAMWRDGVQRVHTQLDEQGVDTRLVIFEGQAHILTESFDESVFYDFWASH